MPTAPLQPGLTATFTLKGYTVHVTPDRNGVHHVSCPDLPPPLGPGRQPQRRARPCRGGDRGHSGRAGQALTCPSVGACFWPACLRSWHSRPGQRLRSFLFRTGLNGRSASFSCWPLIFAGWNLYRWFTIPQPLLRPAPVRAERRPTPLWRQLPWFCLQLAALGFCAWVWASDPSPDRPPFGFALLLGAALAIALTAVPFILKEAIV